MNWDFLKIIISPIVKLFEWTRTLLNNFWLWLISILLMLATPVIWFLDFCNWVITYIRSLVVITNDYVASLWSNFDNSFASAREFLALANGIVPLNQLFVALGIIVFLWAIAITYRAIKSFVPTIS
jgi:hypothetical protein